jgi:hypothetical protein
VQPQAHISYQARNYLATARSCQSCIVCEHCMSCQRVHHGVPAVVDCVKSQQSALHDYISAKSPNYDILQHMHELHLELQLAHAGHLTHSAHSCLDAATCASKTSTQLADRFVSCTTTTTGSVLWDLSAAGFNSLHTDMTHDSDFRTPNCPRIHNRRMAAAMASPTTNLLNPYQYCAGNTPPPIDSDSWQPAIVLHPLGYHHHLSLHPGLRLSCSNHTLLLQQ